jgi:hypothetical protein
MASQLFDCAICGKPVPLETSKTDERGRAVHEVCYLAQLNLAAKKKKKKSS